MLGVCLGGEEGRWDGMTRGFGRMERSHGERGEGKENETMSGK